MRNAPTWRAALGVCVALLLPHLAAAQTNATAAATASLPTGTVYAGVTVTELRLGLGAEIPGDGSAAGQLDATLIGTSAGAPVRTITIDGRVSGGSTSGGSATITGTCTVDPGDGSAPSEKVPFLVTLAFGSGGQSTIALTLGATALPTATVTDGSLTVK